MIQRQTQFHDIKVKKNDVVKKKVRVDPGSSFKQTMVRLSSSSIIRNFKEIGLSKMNSQSKRYSSFLAYVHMVTILIKIRRYLNITDLYMHIAPEYGQSTPMFYKHKSVNIPTISSNLLINDIFPHFLPIICLEDLS